MSDNSRLSELLLRWQDHRDKGQTLSPEELCVGCPEFVDELRQRIDALCSMEAFMGDNSTGPQSNASQATTEGSAPTSDQDVSLTEFLSPPQTDDELGRLGKYRILKVLGHGGMGVVFRAEDPKLKRAVAIKAMLPALAASASAGKRFLREAQAMAAVKHDHVVTIYDVDEQRGVPFLAMELLEGETLEQRLEREGTLPLAEV
jgi:serine/threonine protein kinase